ncbi:hypothetical protein Ahy_Scaffold1g106743 isoform F [Arachis hypogaea]|uniref:NmrA-like domain-containing protein n=1 Tax=Arachis hypogaea TaxID=3818 RepID=A0A444WRU4_ARAHY|nr:hypothetical protein Ahy_Scaffold1g106743 isoform F [Arachis hypogaea]
MATKSKILVIGGTGYIGKHIVVASAKEGHPTFALVRESSVSHPEKSKLIESFKSHGVTLVYVCIILQSPAISFLLLFICEATTTSVSKLQTNWHLIIAYCRAI